MIELLKYTNIIADRIRYYDAIADFTDDTHWYNPFYKEVPEIVVVWADEPQDGIGY